MFLNIEYELTDHPYRDEPVSIGEQWAKIKLQILGDNGQIVKTIFEIQWDILVLLSWFVDNEKAILTECIPKGLEGASIAKGVFDFYQRLDPDIENDHLVDSIYDYRTRHGIRFGLRGTDIDDIYIGTVNDSTTISFCNEEEQWNYEVCGKDLMRKVHEDLQKVKLDPMKKR